MALPKNATDTYETLRSQMLKGAAKPQGLSVIFYHGVLRGLQILTMPPIDPFCPTEKQETAVHAPSPDPDFIRLLANLVLHKQSERMHVY